MNINVVKVIETILTKLSSNKSTAPIIITEPWYILLIHQEIKVLTLSTLPFCNILYKTGNLITEAKSTSSSKTIERKT